MFCLLSYGQMTIEGKVVNKTGLPIAYADIGLEKRAKILHKFTTSR